MRVLVSGAGGFIGSHVVEALVRAGHSVRAIVQYNSRMDDGFVREFASDIRENCEVMRLDVRDPEAMHSACRTMETIVHLAALIGIPYSYRAPHSYVDVNVTGTINLLGAALHCGVGRFVHTSTSEVYGSAQYTPMDEAHPLVGQSPYSATKIAADKLVESYALSFELPTLTIRPFNTYGPRQSRRAVIPTLAAQLLDPTVAVVRAGNLWTVRDLTFVTDTAAAFVRGVEAQEIVAGDTVNLGSGKGYTIESVFELLQEIIGVRKPVSEDAERIRPVRSEVKELISNNTKATRVLQWRPSIDLRTGLTRTVEYLRKQVLNDTATYGV